jgi:ribosome modulation factor
MTGAPEVCPLVCIVIEGAVDRFCGRPRDRNPYAPVDARNYWLAWDFGWLDAGALLEERGQQEAQRWLREAA